MKKKQKNGLIILIAINLKDNRSYEAIFKKIVEFCKEKDEKCKKKGIKNISTRAMIIGIPNQIFDKNSPKSETIVFMVPRIIRTMKSSKPIQNNL